jgi:hypothetical protein
MMFFLRAVTAMDWNDTTSTWAAAQTALAHVDGANLTSFFNDRGLFSARSDWSTSALRVVFQPRSAMGGHSQLDRTKIALSAHGRWWFPYRPIDKPATIASIVFVNGLGPSTIPAAVRAVYDTGGAVQPTGSQEKIVPLASFAVSEATETYSYRFVSATEHHYQKTPVQAADFVRNDFLLQPRATDVIDTSLPFSMFPGAVNRSTRHNHVFRSSVPLFG